MRIFICWQVDFYGDDAEKDLIFLVEKARLKPLNQNKEVVKMTALQVFSFEEGASVRTVGDSQDDSVWFVLRDVLDSMGSTTRPAIARSTIEDVFGAGYTRTTHLETGFGVKETTIISDPAVTYLVSRSNTETSKKLNRWIHSEVLPSIRKSGSYSVQQSEQAEELKQMIAGLSAKIDSMAIPIRQYVKVKDLSERMGGIGSHTMNNILMALGLQVRCYSKHKMPLWKPTNKGKPYCKRSGSMLHWNESVLKDFEVKINKALEVMT